MSQEKEEVLLATVETSWNGKEEPTTALIPTGRDIIQNIWISIKHRINETNRALSHIESRSIHERQH